MCAARDTMRRYGVPLTFAIGFLPAIASAQSPGELAEPTAPGGSLFDAEPMAVAVPDPSGPVAVLTAAHRPRAASPPTTELPPPSVAPDGFTWTTPDVPSPGPEPALRSEDGSHPAELETRDGVSFGETLGHAWAGYGLGLVGGPTLGAMIGCATYFCGGALYGMPAGTTLAPLGAALGAWGWGDLAGADGNFFASLGMSYLGSMVGVTTFLILGFSEQEWLWAALLGPLIGTLLSPLGAAIGYEMTSSGAGPPIARRGSPSIVVLPTVAPSPYGDGAELGVAGIF